MSLSSLSGRVGALTAAALVERITMEADLRNALVTGDLVLRYHPIVDLPTGHTIAFEALCRWRHWSKGLLGPAQFMPLADESGLILGIGAWVLEESTRRLVQWRARLADAGTVDVTVNLSAVELHDPALIDRASKALDSSGLPAERLVVEVTEAAAGTEPRDPAARNLGARTRRPGGGQGNRDTGTAGAAHPAGLPRRAGLPLRPAHGSCRRRGLPPADAPGLSAPASLTVAEQDGLFDAPVPSAPVPIPDGF